MKYIVKNRLFKCALILLVNCSGLLHAQIMTGEAFIKGNYVEVGFSVNGYEGGYSASLPAGYHPRASFTGFLGTVANPQMNGWSAPNYDGDFISTATYETGFGFEFFPPGGGISTPVSNYPSSVEMTSTNSNYQSTPAYSSVDWTFPYNLSGYDLTITLSRRINANDLFYLTTVTITNNSLADTIPEYYYFRSFNPDNNSVITSVTSTTNKIEQQAGPLSGQARVSASENSLWPTYIALVAYDTSARAGINLFGYHDASDIWNGMSGVTTVEDSVESGDVSISIAHRAFNLLPGETDTFKFYTVMKVGLDPDPTGSIYAEFINAGKIIKDTLSDSVYACGTVDVVLEGYDRDNHDWVWVPNTYLSIDTGIAVTANPTTNITYTVTGYGDDTIVYTLTLIPAAPPVISVTTPPAQCATYDLTTLVFSETTGNPYVFSAFLDEMPANGFDLSVQHPSNIITPYDSVYLMFTDSITGCYDLEPVDVFWNDILFDFNYTTTSCTTATATANITGLTGVPGSILWSTGSTTTSVTGIPAGPLSVSVTAAGGCVHTETVTIEENTFTTHMTQTPEGCHNGNGTAAVVAVEPGTYSYLWNMGATTSSLAGLISNVYTVTVTNQDGCVTIDSIQVDSLATTFSLTVADFSASCSTCSDGNIYTFLGGSPTLPVTYLWSNGATTANILGIPTGTYTVVATDAAGCTWSDTVFIGSPEAVNENANDFQLNVFPNPADEFTDVVSGMSMDGFILYAIDGRIIEAQNIRADRYRIYLHDISKGVYLLKIKAGASSKTIRIIRN
jgi:hypothetical protein